MTPAKKERAGHQLARPVEGRLPAALDLAHRHPDCHAPRERRVVGVGPRQDLERQGLEPVANEDRRGLAEHLVARRLTATQIVVVHGRQVVVHQ